MFSISGMTADYWAHIAETTRDALGNAITEALREGATLSGLINRARETLGSVSRRQAETNG